MHLAWLAGAHWFGNLTRTETLAWLCRHELDKLREVRGQEQEDRLKQHRHEINTLKDAADKTARAKDDAIQV